MQGTGSRVKGKGTQVALRRSGRPGWYFPTRVGYTPASEQRGNNLQKQGLLPESQIQMLAFDCLIWSESRERKVPGAFFVETDGVGVLPPGRVDVHILVIVRLSVPLPSEPGKT